MARHAACLGPDVGIRPQGMLLRRAGLGWGAALLSDGGCLARWRKRTPMHRMRRGRGRRWSLGLWLRWNMRLQLRALRARPSAMNLIGFRAGHGGPSVAAKCGGRREIGRDRHHRICGLAASTERNGRNGSENGARSGCRSGRRSGSGGWCKSGNGSGSGGGNRCDGGNGRRGWSAGDGQDRIGRRAVRVCRLHDRWCNALHGRAENMFFDQPAHEVVALAVRRAIARPRRCAGRRDEPMPQIVPEASV